MTRADRAMGFMRTALLMVSTLLLAAGSPTSGSQTPSGDHD